MLHLPPSPTLMKFMIFTQFHRSLRQLAQVHVRKLYYFGAMYNFCSYIEKCRTNVPARAALCSGFKLELYRKSVEKRKLRKRQFEYLGITSEDFRINCSRCHWIFISAKIKREEQIWDWPNWARINWFRCALAPLNYGLQLIRVAHNTFWKLSIFREHFFKGK